MSLLAWSHLPGYERFQRLLSIPHSASIYVLATLAPLFYLRWRPQLLMLHRLTFFMFPLLRRPAGGWVGAWVG